jgi:hypothetical protein
MDTNLLKKMVLLLLGLFCTATIFADPQVGQLLEEAMAARKYHSISAVSDKFITAANSTSSAQQKSNILFIFSDYLIEKQEWEKVIEVQYQIIDYGNPSSQAEAYYNLIRANLELNKIDEAKMAAVELNACSTGGAMRSHARTMKEIASNSIHARIYDLLGETALDIYLDGTSEEETEIPSSSQIAIPAPSPQPHREAETTAPRDSRPFSVLIGGWNSALRGNLDSQGMSLNFGSDLSTDRETSGALAVEFSPNAKDRFKVTYVNFAFSGTLKKTFVHNAKTYNPGAEFHLRNKFLDLEGYRELRQRSRFDWGVLYGIMLTDSDLEIAQNVPGMRQITTWESRFGYPYLGLAARSNNGGSVGWEVSGKFFVWNGDGRYNTHDLELKLVFGKGSRKISSERKFWGYLGYRVFRWDGDFDDDTVEVRFSGPILGIEFYF